MISTKELNLMNTVDRLNAVIDYVEKHITENLDLNQLAGIAQYSLYDFQRMFGFIAEMSIAEYIRKRRLTLAGLDLKHNDIKVIDAALKYGYDSPSAFARAFQAFHDITPSAAKKSDVALRILHRLIFQITVKEVSQMIRTEKITVNGKEYEASYFGEQDLRHLNWPSTKREFWRLEDAYNDFKGCQCTSDVLPYNNYPMNIELEQVFVIDYTKKDGSVERTYYISNGDVWQDMPSTRQIKIEPTEPLRVDKLTVNGKDYKAPYFGEQDISSWSKYAKREFWRLENAYDDFKDKERTNSVLPYNNYNMNIKAEQVFVIDYTNNDGCVERKYYISDGTVWQNMPSTCEISL